MKQVETLYIGYEFYNREDNPCTVISKHFDSYECEEQEIDSPDGLAEIITTRTVIYTASEMRIMLHARRLEWNDHPELIPICEIDINCEDGRRTIAYNTENGLLYSSYDDYSEKIDTPACETLNDAKKMAWDLWGCREWWNFEWIAE